MYKHTSVKNNICLTDTSSRIYCKFWNKWCNIVLTHIFSDYFSSGGSFGSSNDPCANVCGSTNSDSDIECSEEEEEIVVPSEIEATQQPYKEIEAVINDNRMILRLQTEKPQQKYDPPCDCIENPSPPKKQGFSSDACLKQSPSQVITRASKWRLTILFHLKILFSDLFS